MKLFASFTSPYARKVKVVAREKGIMDRMEEVFCDPWADPAELRFHNPHGKVPVLITDEGFSLFNSQLIVDYLDTTFDGPKMIPQSGRARWDVLNAVSLADGVLDASVVAFLERKRPELEQWNMLIDRNIGKVKRAIERMSETYQVLPDELTLAHIMYANALEYVDFRLPDVFWRREHMALADWAQEISHRPSMQETQPREA